MDPKQARVKYMKIRLINIFIIYANIVGFIVLVYQNDFLTAFHTNSWVMLIEPTFWVIALGFLTVAVGNAIAMEAHRKFPDEKEGGN